MPDYNIYYFVIKRPPRPVTGTSGRIVFANPESQESVASRNRILDEFRDTLTDLMQRSVVHIPHRPSRSQNVHVREIPETSPGVPNFSGLSIDMHEPIVYLIHRPAPGSTPQAHPTNIRERRPSLIMVEALDSNYSEFPDSIISSARSSVISNLDQCGFSLHLDDYAPLVAEVYGNPHITWDASNWEEILAKLLAKSAFHEIAHGKAECHNRAANVRWRPAISGSIHDYRDERGNSVSICRARIAWHDTPSIADLRLMGRHMLCPMPYYKLDQPISPQCYHHGTLRPLTSSP